MQIPTVAVQHPDDKSERILVNVEDAHAYSPWVEPTTRQAPAAEGGGPIPQAPVKRLRRARK